MKSRLILTFLLFIGAACDRDGDKPPQLRLGYFVNLTHAQAVLGVSSGEFAAAIAPAKLTTKVFNAGPSLIEALLAGEIDVGYVGPGPVLSAHARTRGEGIRVISGAAANGVIIVARSGSGIRNINDLINKRIATPQHGNTQDIAARHFLQQCGNSDLKNVLPVPNTEQVALMAQGQIDAAWAPEPWGARLIAETGATLIAEEKDLWPDKQFAMTVVVTTPEFLANHGDLITRLLDVHEKWTSRLSKSPSDHLSQLESALLALTGKKLPAGVAASAIDRIRFTNDPFPAMFDTLAQWTVELGFVRRMPGMQKLFVTSATSRPTEDAQ
jgi:NitT/TauT family transport system substrate-binding protein